MMKYNLITALVAVVVGSGLLLSIYTMYSGHKSIKIENNCCLVNDSLSNELFIQTTNVTRYEIIIDRIREKDSTLVDDAFKNVE